MRMSRAYYITLVKSIMSSTTSAGTPPAYRPSSSSSSTNLGNEEHAAIDVYDHHEANSAPSTPQSWLRCFSSSRRTPKEPLTPELEYEQDLRRHVIRGAIYFTVSALILIGSCIGVAVSASSLNRSKAYSEKPELLSQSTLDDLLHLTKAFEDQEADLSVDIYLVAICAFAAIASLIFTLLAGGRLALAVHYRNLSKQDKPHQETKFWKTMSFIFGSKSLCMKKPRLPTYSHAVRQAVLKRGARQGDPQSEFFNISAEEMELERIRKLDGAPPSYPCEKAAHVETA
ncbi:hypothetical protein P389DRAFT_105332 [Cystobasidium minutum MCA 4210]|uniref:uncharacterized protein n=1 Tax=Cystobasidium minutum MCA 4210 TaxID=1397322 RepID=UPI0034CE4ACC|eukprot:jgi/Rhomi1/105332/CE105331_94